MLCCRSETSCHHTCCWVLMHEEGCLERCLVNMHSVFSDQSSLEEKKSTLHLTGFLFLPKKSTVSFSVGRCLIAILFLLQCSLVLFRHNHTYKRNYNYRVSFIINSKEPFHLSNWYLPQPAAESSSLPSGQSLSPSQSQRFGTHAYDPGQLNSPGAHVTVPERKSTWLFFERDAVHRKHLRAKK